MYQTTGLKLDTDWKLMEKRVCPDGEKLKDKWKVRNGYSNKLDRISFNIQAVLCTNPPDNPNYCASDDDIKYLLDRLMFTMYVTEGKILFDRKSDDS